MMNWNGYVFVILVLFAMAVLAILIVHVAVRPLIGTRAAKREAPLDLLKRRYAAGEITPAEYEQARRAIG